MALEDDRRVAIAKEEGIVIRLVEQTRAVNCRERALLDGADVNEFDGGAAREESLQFRRGQLTNRRGPLCQGVVVQRISILAFRRHPVNLLVVLVPLSG
jgi:hypothetical protein